MTVVGTRPEIIRLSRIIPILDKFFDHTLVHTGQNFDFELNGIFFDQMDIREPDYFLNTSSDTPLKTISNIISETGIIIDKIKPDAFLILGDTNSCLSAISAKRSKVPIFHMEAGNRCFDFRVPEEINRKIVDHISDINLTYSQIARQYLLREGLPPDQIITIGSPMKEVLNFYSKQIEESTILKKTKSKTNSYFLVSLHREENVDNKNSLKQVFSTLAYIKNKYKKNIILSCHPRTKDRLKKFKIPIDESIDFHKPFGFIDYINLQQNAFMVISDSGTITEESSILDFPAINLREEHERPEGFEEGSVIFTGMSLETIENSIQILLAQKKNKKRTLKMVKDYDVDNVSEKILRIILSYTHFVNKKTWKKF